MDQSIAIILLMGLLGPLAGCQLISQENLTSTTTPDLNKAETTGKAELPAKATAEVCLTTARLLEKDGKDGDAIVLYEKARQNGPNKVQISRRLAVLYDKQKDYKHAMEEFNQLLKRFPKDVDLLNDVGYCYYNQGNWPEAEKYLRQATTLNPNHKRAWINLGMTLAQNNHRDDSLEAFTKVVSPAQARCNLAFILTTQGKFNEAKIEYRQALTFEPDLELARNALAKLEGAATQPAPKGMPQQINPKPTAPAEDVSGDRLEEQSEILVPLP